MYTGFTIFLNKIHWTIMKTNVIIAHFIAIFQHVYTQENLSFQRPATMSDPLIQNNPEIVVDGDLSQDGTNCIETKHNTSQAWWQVRLQRVSAIERVEIFYKETEVPFLQMRRFAGFSIYVANWTRVTAGVRCYHHESGGYPGSHVDVPCVAIGRIVTIVIERPPEDPYSTSFCYSDDAVLELCEVEVFGCEQGFYGRDCTRTCPTGCVDNQCDPQTGDCKFGCFSSLTGPKCDLNCIDPTCKEYCPEHCADRTCDDFLICTDGCEAGWQGDQCETPCDSEYFGKNCEQRCYCDHGSCDNGNGTCPDEMCVQGWIPPSCSQVALKLVTKTDGMISSTTAYIGFTCLSLVIVVLVISVFVLLWKQKHVVNDKQKPQKELEFPSLEKRTNPQSPTTDAKKLPRYEHLSVSPNTAYYLDPVSSNNTKKPEFQQEAQYEIGEEEDIYYTIQS